MDLRVVSGVPDFGTAVWLLASEDIKRKEANSSRYENIRIFLCDIPDLNPAFIQNYKFLSALFIISSTVRFFSSLTILSRALETALLANPSITNADNASSRFVLSAKGKYFTTSGVFAKLVFQVNNNPLSRF